jgi:hypothetical protein
MENVVKGEITLSAREANIKALVFIIPILTVFGVPFFMIWGKGAFNGLSDIIFEMIFITLAIFILGVVVHELIHGIFWAIFLKKGFKSIKFGIMRQYLTPYCHSKEPMKLKHYRIGAIMPAILLGFLPSIVSLFNGSIAWLVFGVFFSIAAGGDLLMIWLLRKENKNALVQDHPDKIGCILLEVKSGGTCN